MRQPRQSVGTWGSDQVGAPCCVHAVEATAGCTWNDLLGAAPRPQTACDHLFVFLPCSLIRGRALACQMSPARIAGVSAELGSADGSLRLRASASSVAFPGFLAAYFDPAAVSSGAHAGADQQQQEQAAAAAAGEGQRGSEEDEAEAELGFSRRQQQDAARAAAAAGLAALQRGQAVAVHSAAATEHETRPPPRYTEGAVPSGLPLRSYCFPEMTGAPGCPVEAAMVIRSCPILHPAGTLVKALEELGIGRPGTYAPTLNLLQARAGAALLCFILPRAALRSGNL